MHVCTSTAFKTQSFTVFVSTRLVGDQTVRALLCGPKRTIRNKKLIHETFEGKLRYARGSVFPPSRTTGQNSIGKFSASRRPETTHYRCKSIRFRDESLIDPVSWRPAALIRSTTEVREEAQDRETCQN